MKYVITKLEKVTKTEYVNKILDIEVIKSPISGRAILQINGYNILTIDCNGKCRLVSHCGSCGLDVDKDGKIILSD